MTWSQIDGMLPICKPKGMVSKDVSRWIEKRLGRLKLGHVGTLDPMAEGVLPIMIGRGTKFQDYLLDSDKVYEVTAQFGEETDTLDADGEVITSAPLPEGTTAEVHEIAQSMMGECYQVPPLYSAVKFRGKPLYWYARNDKSEEVILEDLKRKVHLISCEVESFDQKSIRFLLRCSKGTYVRTFVKELAGRLGSVATMTALVRRQTAGVTLSQCVQLEDLEKDLEDPAKWTIPLDDLSFPFPSLELSAEEYSQLLRAKGRRLAMTVVDFGTKVTDIAFYSDSGERDVLVCTAGQPAGVGTAKAKEAGIIEISLKRTLK